MKIFNAIMDGSWGVFGLVAGVASFVFLNKGMMPEACFCATTSFICHAIWRISIVEAAVKALREQKP